MLLALLPNVRKAARGECVGCLLKLSGGCTGDRLLWLHIMIFRHIGVLALLNLFAFLGCYGYQGSRVIIV
jgi:hypothetical protein